MHLFELKSKILFLVASLCLSPVASLAQDPPIIRPPSELKGGMIQGDEIGSEELDIIAGVKVKRNLTTGFISRIEDLPAPSGATTRREAAELTIQNYKNLLGVNSDLSNIEFSRESIPAPVNLTSGFSWHQVYNGIRVFGQGTLSIIVRNNLEIVSVDSDLRPISSNPAITFPSDPGPAITEAINILNAGHISGAQAQGRAEQRIYLEEGTPKPAWYITFPPETKIYWWVLVDASTNEPIMADFRGSHRPPSN